MSFRSSPIYTAILKDFDNEFETLFSAIDLADHKLLTDIGEMVVLYRRETMLNFMILYQFKHKVNCFPCIEEVFYAACENNFMWKQLYYYVHSINKPTAKGRYFLEGAAYSNNIDLVLFLLDHGADINLCEYRCLSNAIKTSNTEIVEHFIELLQSTDSIDSIGFLLRYAYADAAYNCDVKMIKLLYRYSVPPCRLAKDTFLELRNAISHHKRSVHLLKYIEGKVIPYV